MEDLSKEQLAQYNELNYESIVTIFSNTTNQKELEKILDMIMEKDKNCPALIIHRRIELYLEKLRNLTDGADDNYG